MICDECETVAHCMKNGCVPKMNKELLQMVFDAMSYGNAEDRESARLAIKFALAEQPAQRTWFGLTDEDLAVCGDQDDVLLARYWERVCKEKNT